MQLGLRSIALSGQSMLGLRPRGLCLVVGCPRSATSSLCRWLNTQPGAVYASQSRILLGAHRLVEELERFRKLQAQHELLLQLTRRLVYAYYARSCLLWRRMLIDKENLEPVALPDGRPAAFLRSVRTLFPQGKLLFLIREPVATVWSITQRQWGQSLIQPDLRSYSIEDGIRIWQASAELIREYAADPETYVCRFERLIAEPATESRRICGFLGLREGTPFQPRRTKVPAFGDVDRERIVRATSALRAAVLGEGPP